MTESLRTLLQVYADSEAIIPVLRGGDQATYQRLIAPVRRLHQTLKGLITRYAQHGAHGGVGGGMAHALPMVEPSQKVAQATALLDPRRVLPAGPKRLQILARQRQLRRDVLFLLYQSLQRLRTILPPNGWMQLHPYVAELHEVLMTRHAPSTESRRRTTSIASKLRGRLALMEETGGLSREVSTACLASRHGARLARLVAAGNRHAIDLVGLVEERDAYRASHGPALDVLADYEHHIGLRRRHLGLDMLTESTCVGLELVGLMRLAAGAGFTSKKHFQHHLCEGLLLNVNTLASKALAIPSGEYVVWLTDAGHTMLVPTSANQRHGDIVHGESAQRYDVLTPKLVGCWSKLERVVSNQLLGEVRDFKTDVSGPEGGKREPRVTKAHQGLPNLRRAREQAGLSLSDVSDRTGLAVSTIAKHELGYANPLHGSMEKIMDALDVDPAAFHRPGSVEPYAHLDPEADDFDPYNVDVAHPGAGHHSGEGDHGETADSGPPRSARGGGHKGAKGPMYSPGASF